MHQGDLTDMSEVLTPRGGAADAAGRGRRLRAAASTMLGAVLLASVLAACALVPPQSVTDPFGLDGTPVPVYFEGAAAALVPQAVNGSARGVFEFDDFSGSLPLNPGSIRNEIRLRSADLDDPDGPATITLTSLVMTVRAWQGAAEYASAEPANRAELTLTMNETLTLVRGDCTAVSCSYEVDGATLGTLRAEGAALRSLLNVATTAPTPNQGQAAMEVVAAEDALAGRTLLIVLDASEGEARL